MRIRIQRTRGYSAFGPKKPLLLCGEGSRPHHSLQEHRSDPIVKGRLSMELDKAFEFALILAWEDLAKIAKPTSLRIEYRAEPGTALDHVSVWSDRSGGYLDLVCDCWTQPSSSHPDGIRFNNGRYSDQLMQALGFIMKNQDQFSRHADACRDGLVLVYPPGESERAEAALWLRGSGGAPAGSRGGAGEMPPPRPATPVGSGGGQSDRAGSAVVSSTI